MQYEACIGLETHVQLKTHSKMWCGCPNAFGAPPNTNVCPVCLGLPGVLPVANEEALRLTALAGLLLSATVARSARFDRKNYFYPDVAKNYQITQYTHPSTVQGYVEFEFEARMARVRLVRAHLEEDVAKNLHFDRHSGVDFNRAGVPLLEIVSEPDITSAGMACAYLNALKDILVYGGISDCDMEKGMVRCDVNVSVRPKGQQTLGAKIEIKNMNSFSGVRKALDCEIQRQCRVLQGGGQLRQETRRWDDTAGLTESMRSKEYAHDYRYFPDPDLMPFQPDDAWLQNVAARQVELPQAKKQRLMASYQIPAHDAETFVNDPPLADLFEAAAQRAPNRKAVANWIINHLRAKLTESNLTLADLRIQPAHFQELASLIDQGRISHRIAQEVFTRMFDTGQPPTQIVEEQGLAQVSDTGALEAICEQILAAHPKSVQSYKEGKEAALNFLKGQVMKATQGQANPGVVGEILRRKLS